MSMSIVHQGNPTCLTSSKEFRTERHKEIILFADAGGGQNRNYTVLSFSAALARTFGATVCRIFPVTGLSYSVCDRNTGSIIERVREHSKLVVLREAHCL